MSHFYEPLWHRPAWKTPDPCIVVTLPEGIELAAAGGPDVEFTLSSWEGWTEGPEVRGGRVSMQNADGDTKGDIFLGGRNLLFEGLIKGHSPSHLWELQEELGAVLTRSRWRTLRVDEEHLGLARQIEVARGGRPTITQLAPKIAQYSLQLQAASALRFSVDQQSVVIPSGGVELLNYGNMDTYPVVSLVGPLTNPGLSWPGGAWVYEASIPAGTTITVDMERRTVRDLTAATYVRHLAAGSWLSIPPGVQAVERLGSGAGSVRAVWRSAWA